MSIFNSDFDPNDSPLNRARQIDRDLEDNLTAVSESLEDMDTGLDAFSDDFEEITTDDSPEKRKRRPNSPPEPDFAQSYSEDEDDDYDLNGFAGNQPDPQDEEDREIFAESILGMIEAGLPYVVHSFTKLPEDKYNRYKKQGWIPGTIVTLVKNTNQEQKDKLESNTAKYCKAMKRPLKKVMRNRGITPPPELVLIGAVVGLGASTAGLVQEIRATNAELDRNIERQMQQYREELKRQSKTAQAPEPEPESTEDDDLAQIIEETIN